MTDNSSALWDDYLLRAELARQTKTAGTSVVNRESLSSELTEFGLLRWYMHPKIHDIVDHALYFFELEIPPHSRSGLLFHQGGIVHLVVEGTGYTLLENAKHYWEALDVIAIPPRPDGVRFAHFNEGEAPARLVVAFPNFDSSLGPELGVRMQVLEPAPEYLTASST